MVWVRLVAHSLVVLLKDLSKYIDAWGIQETMCLFFVCMRNCHSVANSFQLSKTSLCILNHLPSQRIYCLSYVRLFLNLIQKLRKKNERFFLTETGESNEISESIEYIASKIIISLKINMDIIFKIKKINMDLERVNIYGFLQGMQYPFHFHCINYAIYGDNP